MNVRVEPPDASAIKRKKAAEKKQRQRRVKTLERVTAEMNDTSILPEDYFMLRITNGLCIDPATFHPHVEGEDPPRWFRNLSMFFKLTPTGYKKLKKKLEKATTNTKVAGKQRTSLSLTLFIVCREAGDGQSTGRNTPSLESKRRRFRARNEYCFI